MSLSVKQSDFQRSKRTGNPTGRPAGVVELMPRGTNKQAWVRQYKLDKGCADCGYNEYAVALDFDHVRGEKLFNLARLSANRGVSWQRIFDEIAKCEVVCANCHRVRTEARRAVASA